MSNVFKRFIAYWRIVLGRSIKYAIGEGDLRGMIMNIVKALVLFIGIPIIGAILGKNYVPDSFVVWASTNFSENAKGFVAFAFLFSADVFLGILYIPAKMYFEEHRLYTWDEVTVSVESNPIFGVGLRIKSDNDIKEIGREVRSFWKGQSRLFELPIELLTLKEDKQMLTTVKKGVFKSSRMFPVANCDDGKAWLVTSEKPKDCLLLFDKGKYYIEVVFTGMINGRKIEDYVFAGNLFFDGEKIVLSGKRKN